MTPGAYRLRCIAGIWDELKMSRNVFHMMALMHCTWYVSIMMRNASRYHISGEITGSRDEHVIYC